MGRSKPPGNEGDNYYNNVTPSYDVIMYRWGVNYFAENAQGNPIAPPGPVFHTVHNTAISGLPSRTRKYKVVVVGDITITGNCAMDSFLSYDFSAATFTRSGTGFDLFSCTSETDIDIIGGIVNSAAVSGELYTSIEFDFSAVTNLLIDGLTVNDAAEDAVRISGASSNFKVVNCTFYRSNLHAIDVTGAAHNGIIADNYVNSVLVYDGITLYLTDGYAISVIGNTVENVDGSATSSAAIQLEEIGTSPDDNGISCTGNTIYNCQYGIGVASSMRPVTVMGNSIRKCERGIFLQNTLYSTISGNIFNSSERSAATRDIYIYGCQRCTISANSHFGDNVYTTAIYHDGSGLFVGNTISCNSFHQCLNAINGCGNQNTFTGNVFAEMDEDAVLVNTGNQYNTFNGNIFYNNGAKTDNTYSDFKVGGTAGNNMYGLNFIGNQSVNDATNKIAYHINFTSAANTNNITILGIRVTGDQSGIVNGTPASFYIFAHYNDSGKTSESEGTGVITAAATNVTITHNLPYTPTAAQINVMPTANTTVAVGEIWVDTITSTQFNVNVAVAPGASTFTFGWSVRRI